MSTKMKSLDDVIPVGCLIESSYNVKDHTVWNYFIYVHQKHSHKIMSYKHHKLGLTMHIKLTVHNILLFLGSIANSKLKQNKYIT